ncbi:MAG: molybdopterin molybdotransferase MoeA [Planctomycetota bacterium]
MGIIKELLTVEEARDRVLAHVGTAGSETIPLEHALGRVLASPVSTRVDLPPFDTSAMDGFALRWRETRGATPEQPRILRWAESVHAGRPSMRVLQSGEAFQIATGAQVPDGADGVLKKEFAFSRNGHIEALRELRAFENIRRQGEDAVAGQCILEHGVRLGAGEVAMLAAAGLPSVEVRRKPRAFILSNGDEVRPPGEPLAPGKIYDSNRYLIVGRITEWGGEPTWAGCLGDAPRSGEEALSRAGEYDLVVTSAGVSVGERDHLPRILESLGAEILVHGVRAKPGKPFLFALLDGVPVFALPGSPTAAAVAAELFLRPAVRKNLGLHGGGRPRLAGVWEGGTYGKKRGRRLSSRVLAMVRADGLVDIPPDQEVLKNGTSVEFLSFHGPANSGHSLASGGPGEGEIKDMA